MPLHSAFVDASEIHQDKLIVAALVADAGKVTTPSSVTPGVGVLRFLATTETTTGQMVADAGKVFVQRADLDGAGEWRHLSPDDIEAYTTVLPFDFADVSVVGSQYGVSPQTVTAISIQVVLYAALTVADETITVTVGGATPVALVVPFAASATGTVVVSLDVPLSAVQPRSSLITVVSAGTSTGPAQARVFVTLEA